MSCHLLQNSLLQPICAGEESVVAVTMISPNFLVWKFCGKAEFPYSFGRFARNYAETMPFRKISTPGN